MVIYRPMGQNAPQNGVLILQKHPCLDFIELTSNNPHDTPGLLLFSHGFAKHGTLIRVNVPGLPLIANMTPSYRLCKLSQCFSRCNVCSHTHVTPRKNSVCFFLVLLFSQKCFRI